MKYVITVLGTIAILQRLGINHDAWSVDGGFTWNVPAFREELLRFWKENR